MYGEKLFDLKEYGTVALSGSTAILDRKLGIDSYRGSGGAEWSNHHVLPGGVLVNPFAEGRFDDYQIDNSFTGASDEISRGVETGRCRVRIAAGSRSCPAAIDTVSSGTGAQYGFSGP